MKPLLLFDVDGTLLLTGGVAFQTMRRVAESLFGAAFRWDGIAVAGGLDPLIFAEAAALNGLDADPKHHREFRARYLAELPSALERERARLRALPGVLALLQILRQQSPAILGLLTGNYTEAIPIKLGAVGIEPAWFEITAFGDEAPTRPALAGVALAKYQRSLGCAVVPRRVLVVGDTPRDVECAHANGCRAFAVATGAFSVDQLVAAGADFVAPDLSDPAPLLDAVALAAKA